MQHLTKFSIFFKGVRGLSPQANSTFNTFGQNDETAAK